MKTFKKVIASVLAFAMVAAVSVGATVAYLQDDDSDVNVMTLGNVTIEQIEQERDENGNLVEFTQAKPLYPAVFEGSSIPWDAESVTNQAWKVVEDNSNVIDKFVTVKNTGKTEAYVRTIIAYEGNATYGPEGAWIHVVHNGDNVSPAIEINYIGVSTIDGVEYSLYEYVYPEILAPGATTIPSLKQVYMNKNATNEVVAVYGDTYDILVYSQAVQTAGFADAKTALDTAFGDITTTNHPWIDGVVIPEIVSTPEELTEVLAAAADAGSGSTTIYLAEDIDMTGVAWTPIKVDGYHGADVITLNGQGNTITGLTAPLFAGGFAGESGIEIKHLTIADSNIVSTNSTGSGAFIESVDSMQIITLEDCHLVNSTVSGPDRVGGLIGWTSGYSNVNDGPVKTYVTIKDCSVTGCEITGGGSVGAINGHAGASDWTYTTIENCKVINNTLTSTDAGGWRVGSVIGTANVGEVTISNVTHGGNTMIQANASSQRADGLSEMIGRFVPGSTGKLAINGEKGVSVVDSASDLKTAISNPDGKEIVLSGDVTYSSAINNDAVINLDGNTFEATSTLNLGNNADLTMTGGDYVVNGTYGHVDVRPSTEEGSVVVFEDVDFSYNKLNNTLGPSTNRLGSVVEVCATATDAHTEIVFKNCTFDNAQVLFEGMSGKTGTFEATFDNCTFNALTSSAPIYVQNYVTGTINVKNCTFNLKCTSSTASAISISPSTSTNVTVNAENNTINATAATPTDSSVTGVDVIKVNGTPAGIKFISAYANSTINESDTTKTGIAQ